jgi:hypothetical protein
MCEIQVPKLRSHILKITSSKFSGFDLGNHECENPGPKVEIPSLENHVLKTISLNFLAPNPKISGIASTAV